MASTSPFGDFGGALQNFPPSPAAPGRMERGAMSYSEATDGSVAEHEAMQSTVINRLESGDRSWVPKNQQLNESNVINAPNQYQGVPKSSTATSQTTQPSAQQKPTNFDKYISGTAKDPGAQNAVQADQNLQQNGPTTDATSFIIHGNGSPPTDDEIMGLGHVVPADPAKVGRVYFISRRQAGERSDFSSRRSDQSVKVAIGLLLFLAFFVGEAKAQCVGGLAVTVCPADDTAYSFISYDASHLTKGQFLKALSPSDHVAKWEVELPESDSEFLGPVVTPTALIVWSGFPGTQIDSLDRKTGKLLWKMDTSSHYVTAMGHYVLISDAEHWEGLTAVDDRTGKRIWHHTASKPTAGGVNFTGGKDDVLLTDRFAIDIRSGQILRRWPQHTRVASPMVFFVGDALGMRTSDYPGHPANLSLHTWPAYRTLWAEDDPEKENIRGTATDADHIFFARYPYDAPLLRPGDVTLEMIAASTGKTLWRKTITSASTLYGPVALSGKTAVFVTDDSPTSSVVQGFDVATEQTIWTIHSDEKLFGGVACENPICFIEAVASPGDVLAVNAETGAQSWFHITSQ